MILDAKDAEQDEFEGDTSSSSVADCLEHIEARLKIVTCVSLCYQCLIYVQHIVQPLICVDLLNQHLSIFRILSQSLDDGGKRVPEE